MIQFSHVTKQYSEGGSGLRDISLRIDDGEFVFLVGPSGAGKTTFIKLLMKEIEPDSGQILFDDLEVSSMSKRQIPYYRRRIGVVFQDFRLLETMTVYENIAFAMEAVHQNKKLIRMQVPHILDLVGISEKADRYPGELSGGEAQRAAIARAIINDPGLLIADEPTGNLDPKRSWEIMHLLNKINLRGTTVVMVTHDQDAVRKMGKRVIHLDQGKIVRDYRAGTYGGGQSSSAASVFKAGRNGIYGVCAGEEVKVREVPTGKYERKKEKSPVFLSSEEVIVPEQTTGFRKAAEAGQTIGIEKANGSEQPDGFENTAGPNYAAGSHPSDASDGKNGIDQQERERRYQERLQKLKSSETERAQRSGSRSCLPA